MAKELTYRVNGDTLPDAEDLFSDLAEAYEEVTRLRDEIETLFNESGARAMLQGFIVVGKTDLRIKWTDDNEAIVTVPLLPQETYKTELS